MKHPLSILLFLFLCSNPVIGQTYSKAVPDVNINELMIIEMENSKKYREDRKLCPKKIKKKPISWKSAMITFSEDFPYTFEFQIRNIIYRDNQSKSDLAGIEDLFDIDDFNFMKNQFEGETIDYWKLKLRKANLKENPKINFYAYTIPLFDKNYQRAIIYKEFYCGTLCAHGSIELYFKIDGIWKFYKSIPLWIS